MGPGWAVQHLISRYSARRARRYTAQDAVIQQAKLFLKTENEQVLERHRAQRQSQTSSLLPNQEDGLTEEMKMGQVGGCCCTQGL